MELGYAVAAAIAAGPATVSAWAGLRNGRKLKTNHGKDIGPHVEDLVTWAEATSVSLRAHQESDNDLREALGLERTDIPFPDVN